MTKVAMITGGAQGIGAEVARHLSKKGFDIAIGDLPQQKEKAQAVITEVASAGQKAVFIPLDVTNQENVAKAVDDAASQLGGFDVMVNNAGVAKVDKFIDIKPEDLEFSFKINVFGVIYGTQAAAKKFKELGVHGKIINASSIAVLFSSLILVLNV